MLSRSLQTPIELTMTEYDATHFTVEPVEGDDQIAITIHASDGNKWIHMQKARPRLNTPNALG